MDEFKTITPSTSVVKIATCLEKIYKKICDSREKKVPDHQIKEIDFLKSQCKTESVQLNLMSAQMLVRLVEDGVLEAPNVLAMLISLLPNSSPTQYSTVSEGITTLLMLSLKRRVATLKENEVYQTQYGMKIQQHPIISLLQSPSVSMNDVVSKIIGICNHPDRQIQEHCMEYLRPVFLYILCNPQTLPDSKPIWASLLTLSKNNPNAKNLVTEVICWSKISTSSTCLFTSTLLIEASDHYIDHDNFAAAIDLCLFQTVVVKHLVRFGIDPRPSLQCFLRVLYAARNHSQSHYNVLLILLAECLHLLPPHYLSDLLRIISFIVVQESCGHQYILNMCLDGIILWMSQTAFIPADGLALAHQIVRKILAQNSEAADTTMNSVHTKQLAESTQLRNLHPDIALAFDVANLTEFFAESEYKDVFNFVDSLNVKANIAFCHRLNLFLRAVFLSREPSTDCWFKIFEVILQIIKANSEVAYDFMMTYIFKLAKEINPEIQIELLRGLPSFAVSKDNIPMIINTIRNLNDDNPTFSMDLYLSLWRVEPRTYPFLMKRITTPPGKSTDEWEYQLAKTHIIREICYERPTQHGADMVSHLSDTLNTCTDEFGDLSTSLAMDAITALCESHTTNMISTWRAISSKFRQERRPRTLKSLYRFLALVPALETPGVEHEQLVDEALKHLWAAVMDPDLDAATVREALIALKGYNIGTVLLMRHIPLPFRTDSPDYTNAGGREIIDLRDNVVPGECWVKLLQKVRPDCGTAAADLVAHHISNEINEYRSGVYRMPEDKPEPRRVQGLFSASVVRAVTNYLVTQSRMGERSPEIYGITFALRALSKRFPKPIPPLDWSIFLNFINISFEARKYCILIAKNQVLHSSTARRFLENFLAEFEPNCFEEDLLLLFSLLPEIANGVSLTILKSFAEKVAVYCFKESQLNGFLEGCLFENFLESVKPIFTGKCDIPEVRDIFTLIVERYMDSMDLDSRVFERYTDVVSVLSPNSIDGLTSPANWWEVPTGKLKKATIIRCYLVLYNTELPNPLKWLAPIIDAYISKPEEQAFLFRHLAATFYAFNSDEKSCSWIMEIFLQVQNLLAEPSSKDSVDKALYLLDIFILAVDVFSGCAVLYGNFDIVATQRKERFEIFPESMQLLCDHIFWKEQETKIYEILYNLFRNGSIPEAYKEIFRDAIICSRNKPYFDNKSIWSKYVGLR